MLGQNEFGHTCRRLTILVLGHTVVLGTVDKCHDISVLLDCTRLTKVAQLRSFVTATKLRLTAQLRQRNDRHVQLLGDRLQRTRNGRNLLLTIAALTRLTRGHQLQVVDHDQLNVVVYLQTARLRAELIDRQRRSVINVERSRTERLGRNLQMAPLVGRQFATLDRCAVQSRLGDNQSLHQLFGAHFEREEGYGTLVIDRDVACHRQHKCGLTHRGTRRQNHQIRGLPTERFAVDTDKSRRNATERILVFTRLFDRLQSLG